MTMHWLCHEWPRDRRSRWLVYGVLFVVALLVRMACFTGLVNSDDLGYSYFAQLASRGSYAVIGSHLGLRVGLTLPAGAVYALFGASEFTTVLVPLLASSACAPLLTAVGLRLANPLAALLAGLLMLSFPVDVRYASVLVPETVVAFWILTAALVYWHARSSGRWLAGSGAGVLFGVAYLTKEIAVFVAAAFLLDAVLMKRWRLFASVVAGLALVLAAELAAYAVATGDPLYRSHVVQSSQLRYFAEQMESARSSWRLFREYPREMLVPSDEMGLHSLVTLLLAAAGLLRMHPSVRRLVLAWALVPFLYLDFGSASLTTYLPVAAGPRYVAIVYAPLFLIAGTTLERWLQTPTRRWQIGSALLIVVALDIGCAYLSRATGYHTDEIGSLRSIARREELKSDRAVTFAGPRAKAWAFSLRLLGPSLGSTSECLAVGPDAAGLPHVSAFFPCLGRVATHDGPQAFPLE